MNLRQRAWFAHLDRVRGDEVELERQALRALRELIGGDTPIEPAGDVPLRPYTSPAMATFEADGLTFTVKITVTAKEGGASGGNVDLAWDETTIAIWLQREPSSEIHVHSLADIGKALSKNERAELVGELDAETPEVEPYFEPSSESAVDSSDNYGLGAN